MGKEQALGKATDLECTRFETQNAFATNDSNRQPTTIPATVPRGPTTALTTTTALPPGGQRTILKTTTPGGATALAASREKTRERGARNTRRNIR